MRIYISGPLIGTTDYKEMFAEVEENPEPVEVIEGEIVEDKPEIVEHSIEDILEDRCKGKLLKRQQSRQRTDGDRIEYIMKSTEKMGQDRADLLTRIELIEDTVMEAVGEQEAMYPYLLKYVTEEKTTYNQMVALGMPFGSTLFYAKRRKFYYLLSKKI